MTLLSPLGAQASENPRVLVLVTSGLSWSDVNPQEKVGKQFLDTLGSARVANLIRHNAAKTTCPLDGYLTLSTGMRLTATEGRTSGHCPDIPELSAGAFSSTQIKEWVKDARQQNDRAAPGTLGEKLAENGKQLYAIGRGAAIAAMDTSGKVTNYSPRADLSNFSTQIKTVMEKSEVTIVDVGQVSASRDIKVSPTSLNATPADGLPGADRVDKAQSSQVLAALTAALQAAKESDLVFGLDVADHSAHPHLGMAFVRNPKDKPGIIRSSSTRQLGLTSTVDFTQQILVANGVNDADYLIGGNFSIGRDYGMSDNLDWLRNQSLRADQATILQARFIVLIGVTLLLSIALLIVLQRRLSRSIPRKRQLVGVCLCLSASLLGPASALAANIPAKLLGATSGNFSANALKMSVPLLSLQFFWIVIIIAVILAALCLALGSLIAKKIQFLRYSAPVIVAACFIIVWILVSLLTGSPDQISTMFSSPATSATRFYGLNNNKYSFLFSAVLALECLILSPLVKRFPARSKRYFVMGFSLLALAVIIDGFPWLGADVGGPLAMILGVGITLNLVLGKRVTTVKIAALMGVALLSSTLFVLVDNLANPRARTHFGRFISEVANGGGAIVVRRKAEAMINTFGGPIVFTILMALVIGVIVLGVLAHKRGKSRGNSSIFARITSAFTSLRAIPGAYRFGQGVLLTAILAALTNDSGALILVCAGLFTIPALNALLLLNMGNKKYWRKEGALTPKSNKI